MQILPDIYPKTEMYAWTGYLANGSTVTSTPGPLIRVPRHKNVSVVWQNNIKGPPLLAIDTNINSDKDLQTYLN